MWNIALMAPGGMKERSNGKKTSVGKQNYCTKLVLVSEKPENTRKTAPNCLCMPVT